METKYCPECGEKSLCFIEQCDASEGETKASWTCDCCTNIVYIYESVDEDFGYKKVVLR